MMYTNFVNTWSMPSETSSLNTNLSLENYNHLSQMYYIFLYTQMKVRWCPCATTLAKLALTISWNQVRIHCGGYYNVQLARV